MPLLAIAPRRHLLRSPSLATGSSLNTDIAVFYRMDERDGIAIDWVGAQHLSDSNLVGTQDGVDGTARQFIRAQSQYLASADADVFSAGDDGLTIACFVSLASLGAANE